MTPWSEQEIVQLRRLVAEGLSATEIAGRMGRKRNAVISKIHRDRSVGTLARSRPAGAPRKPRPSRAKAKVHPKARPATPKPQAPRPASPRSLPEPPFREAAPLQFSAPVLAPVGFLDAVDGNRCLHFVGDPFGSDGLDMPVCGAERTAAHPRYCPRHARSSVMGLSA